MHTYLKTLLACVLLLLLAVAAINFAVNPFAIFPSPDIAGVNARKTEFFKHIRLVKAYALRRMRPDVLLLGNSRVDMALDPRHTALWRISDKVHNAALTSGTLYESLRYLQHAHRLNPVKLAVLGLDKGMFESLAQADFDETILATTLDSQPNTLQARHLFRTALSLDTLAASWATLRRQRENSVREFRSDGMRLTENAAHAIEREGGYRAVFGKTLIRASEADNEAVLAMERQRMLVYFRRLLDFCRAEKIALKLFIHPIHAWTVENYSELGQHLGFERWKRDLVKILAEEAGANHPVFSLWDFSGYNSVTTEVVPTRKDRSTRMRYYWEPLHYTQLTGDMILDRIFEAPDLNRPLPIDFGILLSKQNIDDVIAKSRLDQQRYRADFANDVLEIKRLVTGNSN